jgi:hypothetical protein
MFSTLLFKNKSEDNIVTIVCSYEREDSCWITGKGRIICSATILEPTQPLRLGPWRRTDESLGLPDVNGTRMFILLVHKSPALSVMNHFRLYLKVICLFNATVSSSD